MHAIFLGATSFDHVAIDTVRGTQLILMPGD
jgi:hypothetical protein